MIGLNAVEGALLAYQEIYHRSLWKLSVGQGFLFVLFAVAGIALIAFAISYHNGQISHRLLMIAMGILINCIGPLAWWSGSQTNKEVSGLPEKFKECTATSGTWRAYSESKNSPRWFEVMLSDGADQPIILYDRWQIGSYDAFEQKMQTGQVPIKIWYVQREETGAQPVLTRVEVDV